MPLSCNLETLTSWNPLGHSDGPGSSVGIATDCGLYGPGSNAGGPHRACNGITLPFLLLSSGLGVLEFKAPPLFGSNVSSIRTQSLRMQGDLV